MPSKCKLDPDTVFNSCKAKPDKSCLPDVKEDDPTCKKESGRNIAKLVAKLVGQPSQSEVIKQILNDNEDYRELFFATISDPNDLQLKDIMQRAHITPSTTTAHKGKAAFGKLQNLLSTSEFSASTVKEINDFLDDGINLQLILAYLHKTMYKYHFKTLGQVATRVAEVSADPNDKKVVGTQENQDVPLAQQIPAEVSTKLPEKVLSDIARTLKALSEETAENLQAGNEHVQQIVKDITRVFSIIEEAISKKNVSDVEVTTINQLGQAIAEPLAKYREQVQRLLNIIVRIPETMQVPESDKVQITSTALNNKQCKDILISTDSKEGAEDKRVNCKDFNDKVYVDEDNEDIFNDSIKPILDAAFTTPIKEDVVLFGYGFSGAGKTYTILGVKEDKGVLPLSIEYLFETEVIKSVSLKSVKEVRAKPVFEQTSKLDSNNRLFNSDILTHDVSSVTLTRENVQMALQRFLNDLEDIRENFYYTIKFTPNNAKSSRGHLFIKFEITFKNDAGPKYLTFIDMAGLETVEEMLDKIILTKDYPTQILDGRTIGSRIESNFKFVDLTEKDINDPGSYVRKAKNTPQQNDKVADRKSFLTSATVSVGAITLFEKMLQVFKHQYNYNIGEKGKGNIDGLSDKLAKTDVEIVRSYLMKKLENIRSTSDDKVKTLHKQYMKKLKPNDLIKHGRSLFVTRLLSHTSVQAKNNDDQYYLNNIVHSFILFAYTYMYMMLKEGYVLTNCLEEFKTMFKLRTNLALAKSAIADIETKPGEAFTMLRHINGRRRSDDGKTSDYFVKIFIQDCKKLIKDVPIKAYIYLSKEKEKQVKELRIDDVFTSHNMMYALLDVKSPSVANDVDFLYADNVEIEWEKWRKQIMNKDGEEVAKNYEKTYVTNIVKRLEGLRSTKFIGLCLLSRSKKQIQQTSEVLSFAQQMSQFKVADSAGVELPFLSLEEIMKTKTLLDKVIPKQGGKRRKSLKTLKKKENSKKRR
jgi:hypothetical protein